MIRRFVFAIALMVFAAPAWAQPFTFAAIGDMPYNIPGDYARFQNVITEINRRAPAFTIHVGDIKSGSTPCTDENFARVRDMFMTFEQPLIYTPGDNEWTDCHRANNGGFDPIERLATVRRMFFPDNRGFGRQRLTLIQQGAEPAFAAYVENQRWAHNNVLFATVHAVGSNNNLQRDRAAVEEYLARNAANLAWIRAAFDLARSEGRAALVIAMQVDLQPGSDPDTRTGVNDTIAALIAGAAAFDRPVLVINGDSHEFRVDQPFVGPGNRRVANLTRLIVHGSSNVHGTLVHVDPTDATSPWSFRPTMIRENMPAR